MHILNDRNMKQTVVVNLVLSKTATGANNIRFYFFFNKRFHLSTKILYGLIILKGEG